MTKRKRADVAFADRRLVESRARAQAAIAAGAVTADGTVIREPLDEPRGAAREAPEFAPVDVSFISLQLVPPAPDAAHDDLKGIGEHIEEAAGPLTSERFVLRVRQVIYSLQFALVACVCERTSDLGCT